MTPSLSDINAILETLPGAEGGARSLDKLHGDASNRIYYRLRLVSGNTLILMQLPAGASSISEEVTNLNNPPQELPFVNIHRYLLERKLPVPEIKAFDRKKGWMILEDLGDLTLEKKLLSCSPEEQKGWYRRAISLLVHFQAVSQTRDPDCLAFQRSFDETLLDWEFDHFLEYGIEARRSLKIPEEEKKAMHQGTRFITFALTKLPQVLVHRDFQSRNLMLDPKNQSLRLLDFQDALMGPLPYDLVALLRDSYVALPWSAVSELIEIYLDEREKKLGLALDRRLFQKTFDWMTIQRKLKDAGRFVYIDRVKKNPSFLPHIPNSLAYAREAFERQPELENLFSTLKKYVPEFNP